MSEVYLVFISEEIDSEGRPVGHQSLFGVYAEEALADAEADLLRSRGLWAGIGYAPIRR